MLGPFDRPLLDAVGAYGVLTAELGGRVTGRSERAVRRSLERLLAVGRVDRYELTSGGELWTLSMAEARVRGIWPFPGDEDIWDVLSLLRGVGLVRLRLWAERGWPEAEWTGKGFRKDGHEYGVLVGRLWPGEISWMRSRLEEAEGRWLVVCGDREQAEELVRVTRSRAAWRVTWDAALEETENPWRVPASS